jgi:hypothetical protein
MLALWILNGDEGAGRDLELVRTDGFRALTPFAAVLRMGILTS